MDKVWENIVAGLAGVQVQQGTTLEEQLALAQKREKLQKEIAKLEKLAWTEKQPKRKFEILPAKWIQSHYREHPNKPLEIRHFERAA